jgi:hypothetical protein
MVVTFVGVVLGAAPLLFEVDASSDFEGGLATGAPALSAGVGLTRSLPFPVLTPVWSRLVVSLTSGDVLVCLSGIHLSSPSAFSNSALAVQKVNNAF